MFTMSEKSDHVFLANVFCNARVRPDHIGIRGLARTIMIMNAAIFRMVPILSV
jgi:hypothetical protein